MNLLSTGPKLERHWINKTILFFLLSLSSPAFADGLGNQIIDKTLTVTWTNGDSVDCDAAPTYEVYEDETGTPIQSGSMALLNDAGTIGFYSEQLTLSAANGYEVGKSYSILMECAVSSTARQGTHSWDVVADPFNASTDTVNIGQVEGTDATDYFDGLVVNIPTGKTVIQ